MRVIAGAWRGRPLASPPGAVTRPTSDRAREGLFSMLASRLGGLDDLQVADLYAGSGALGIEALSRAAAHCLFVDRDRAAVDCIARNLAVLGAEARATVRLASADRAPAPPRPCDLVLIDPPYGTAPLPLLDHLAASGWLAPGAWLSLEAAAPPDAVPDGLAVDTARRFGKAWITLLRDAR